MWERERGIGSQGLTENFENVRFLYVRTIISEEAKWNLKTAALSRLQTEIWSKITWPSKWNHPFHILVPKPKLIRNQHWISVSGNAHWTICHIRETKRSQMLMYSASPAVNLTSLPSDSYVFPDSIVHGRLITMLEHIHKVITHIISHIAELWTAILSRGPIRQPKGLGSSHGSSAPMSPRCAWKPINSRTVAIYAIIG